MATAPEDGFRLAVDPDRMLDLKILSELSR
jgi:hypothetical protein